MGKMEYDPRKFHEGLARAFGDKRERGYVNFDGHPVIFLTDKAGNIVFASKDDINWKDPVVKSYTDTIKKMQVQYGLSGEDFENGTALVRWTLLPDGRYFADDDGFGAEDNDEINIYCYIDKNGDVIVPFQGMTNAQIIEFREIAEEVVSRDTSTKNSLS